MAKRCFLMYSFLIAVLLWKTAAGAEEWDISRCLELGLKQNPRIIAAAMATEAAKARVVLIPGGLLSQSGFAGGFFPNNATFNTPSVSGGSSVNNQYKLSPGIDAKHL